MAKRIIKYNPAFLTDEELRCSFAVRQTDFDIIMRIIRENTTNVNQHVLVIGPRGIGKTTLLLRIGLETRTAEDLKDKWYPLVFAEESYSICSVGEFWLETLFHVAQQTGDKKWDRIINELNKEKDDKRLSERALAKLLDFADSHGKRLLLIVENFNMLFENQVSDDDAWSLRHTLINEPRIMLLASATSKMDQVENSGSAMYELFKQHELKPLETEECRAVWEAVTGESLKDDRIRPIQILTGGNPRLLSIISSFGSKLSFQELMGDLLNLVDDNTEYFKSHLDNLPPIERKAYLALAELWDPAPAKEIARLARLDVSKTSSLMARLINRGAVKVSDDSKRTKLYQTTERMYNIYYLMRKRGAPSERVKAVVNFMVTFYGHDDLLHVTSRIVDEACSLMEAQKAFIKAAQISMQDIKDNPVSSDAINGLAWSLYKCEDFASLQKAHEWIKKAIVLKPEDVMILHTYACVLTALNKGNEAISAVQMYLNDSTFALEQIDDTIELFAGLAAAGCGKQSLDILAKSPIAEKVEPLIVGIRLYLGEEVQVATEILEVAKDVRLRIEKMRDKIEERTLNVASTHSTGTA